MDYFSRFTWVDFVRKKLDSFTMFKTLCWKLQKEKNCGIVRLRSDHGREFKNLLFIEFCESHGIAHEFFALKITEQIVW